MAMMAAMHTLFVFKRQKESRLSKAG